MNEPESIVLCEGFHDRAFWAEWFIRLSCTDPGIVPGKAERLMVKDPRGRPVSRGQFAFRSPAGLFIGVVPCGGKPNVFRDVKDRVQGRNVDPFKSLVVCVDADGFVTDESGGQVGTQLPDLESHIRNFEPSVAEKDGWLELDDGGSRVALVRWETNDPPGAGLPEQQTLERLVCAAILAAYPDRGDAVQGWLQSRPDPPLTIPKEFAWSQMAGWYAKHGCEDFYREVWRDAPVAEQLERRLRQTGAWGVAEEICGS